MAATICGTALGKTNADLSMKNEEPKPTRITACQENYRTLFGDEALTDRGSDPELMAILQKYIFGDVFRAGELDLPTRELITCVSLTALQALPLLRAHAEAALRVGVTPIALREAIYQCAPFLGFPRTLNAMSVVNEVFAEQSIPLPLEPQSTVTEENRYERGRAIQEPLYGTRMRESLQGVPAHLGDTVARMLTELCFGDFYARNGLDLPTRELLTFCLLTTLGADAPLQSHLEGCLKAGNSIERMAAAVIQTLPYIGFPAALKALRMMAAYSTEL